MPSKRAAAAAAAAAGGGPWREGTLGNAAAPGLMQDIRKKEEEGGDRNSAAALNYVGEDGNGERRTELRGGRGAVFFYFP